jgi:uncharacterized protein (TIGR04255 family)
LTGPLYPNQPLVEVATEVRFKGDLSIEKVRADYQGKIRSQYPNLLVPGAKQGIAPPLQPFRFESEDRLSGIQLAINSLSYFSREYLGHEDFLSEINNALDMLIKLVGPIEVTRIGWRYVNAIPFTRDNGLLPLDKYFGENHVFGNALRQQIKDLSYRVLVPITDGQVHVKLESAESSKEPGMEILLLDIDASRLHEPSSKMQLDEVMKEIEVHHEVAYKTFEDLITDSYRGFLRGGQ